MGEMVIHFGLDDCYRVQVLRHSGYEVTELLSLDRLRADLQQRSEQVAAVIISEHYSEDTERIVDTVKQHSDAPVLLLRRTQRTLDEKKFDRVYDSLTTPWIWISGLFELIARYRAGMLVSPRLQRSSLVAKGGPQLLSQFIAESTPPQKPCPPKKVPLFELWRADRLWPLRSVPAREDVLTINDLESCVTARRRLQMSLLTVFSLNALLLAIIGIFMA